MKNVYFVLANKSYGKALYFPYASGCLAAYAWADEEIRSEYALHAFLEDRTPSATALAGCFKTILDVRASPPPYQRVVTPSI